MWFSNTFWNEWSSRNEVPLYLKRRDTEDTSRIHRGGEATLGLRDKRPDRGERQPPRNWRRGSVSLLSCCLALSRVQIFASWVSSHSTTILSSWHRVAPTEHAHRLGEPSLDLGQWQKDLGGSITDLGIHEGHVCLRDQMDSSPPPNPVSPTLFTSLRTIEEMWQKCRQW